MTQPSEMQKKYFDAWWNREALDKVPLLVHAPAEKQQPLKIYLEKTEDKIIAQKTIADQEQAIRNNFYGGVAFPRLAPKLGTDVFSACLGAELKFTKPGSQTYSWADWKKPVLKDYSAVAKLALKDDNYYLGKMKEFTACALDIAPGRCCVDVFDIHGDLDALAVLRGGPETACMDIYDHPDGVKAALNYLWKAWRKVHEELFAILKQKQHGMSNWLGLWSPGTTSVIQDDFICLISVDMFKEFFLEYIVKESEYLDHAVFHLDGPDSIKHLDLLLEIKDLDAIQWACGPAYKDQGVAMWIPLFKKVQAAKKGIRVSCKPHEVEFVKRELKPEGLIITVPCATEKEARELLEANGWK